MTAVDPLASKDRFDYDEGDKMQYADYVLVRPGQPATVQLNHYVCTSMPEAVRWTIHSDRSYQEVGYEPHVFTTKNLTHTVQFETVGSYEVRAEPADRPVEHDRFLPDIPVSEHVPRLAIHTVFVHESDLPRDGSVHSFSFKSLCCPLLTHFTISGGSPDVFIPQFRFRFVEEATGQVIWEGNHAYGPVYDEFNAKLEKDWNGTIRVDVWDSNPRAAHRVLGDPFHLDFRAASLGFGGYDQI